jgi:dienelactone hydrolase
MKSFILGVLLMLTSFAQAAIQTKPIEYKQGDAVLDGTLIYDDAIPGKRPGVVVIHDWMGPGAFVYGRAAELAKLGYTAFVADIYGKGVRPKDSQEASALAGKFKNDRPEMRARARAALDILAVQPQTDPLRVAAIGYCFGGTTALEMARAGAPLAGVVSFHGGLSTPTPQDAKKIKAKVLVLHGAADPHVPPAEVAAFEKEMDDGKVDWTLVKYSGAVHAFAVPGAGNDPSKGAAYNAAADRRSWQAMKDFFVEIFKQP